MKSVEKTIRLAPFDDSYKEYLRKCEDSDINCLEGAIRSGKTIVNLVAFSHYVDNHKEGGLFVASSTTASIAWEILAENRGNTSQDGKYGADQGFGLLYLFKGRCKRTKIKGSPGLSILNKYKKKVDIVFVGAKNAGCCETVRGLTIQGWIATELENHSVVEGDDFIGFMFGRMLGARNFKAFLDLNPSYPSNRMYTEYLDNFAKLPTIKFNYLKCSLFNNTALSQEQIDRTLSLYKDKNSVMYKRDILGERAASAGGIFTDFAVNSDKYIITDICNMKFENCFYTMGIDFGGNGSNTAVVLTKISNNFKSVIPLYDDELNMSDPDNVTVKAYEDFLKRFFYSIRSIFGNIVILYCYCDNADPVMVNETTRILRDISKPTRVYGCIKRTIKDRIKLKAALMSTGHWKVYKDATHVINSTQTQVWNNKIGHEDERLDDGTCDIDIADAEEYSWTAFYDKLNKFNV